jgi:acetyl esterase
MEAIKGLNPSRSVIYKSVEERDLKLHIFNPTDHQDSQNKPVIIYFFGGGWVSGTPTQFFPHCHHLASRGLVAISAEYRVKNNDGTSPIECVKDGKSAVRWVKKNATELGIDPNKVILGGGSAGGHVAAACATTQGFEEEHECSEISTIPNALVLYNPVFDNGPEGYGHERVKDYWKEFSPYHNLSESTPPTLVLLGTQDDLIPVKTAEGYRDRMTELGGRCDLVLYEGQQHGFFNLGKNPEYYEKTQKDSDKFLSSLGLLS